MAIILPANTLAAGGFSVDNSCRFNDGDSAYMEKSPASNGSNTTATFSAWVKRGNLGARQAIFGGQEGTDTNNRCVMEFNASDQLVMQTGNGGSFVNKVSNRVFRDCSSWYHLIFQFDTTNGTASSRWKFFVNGVEETSLATDNTFPDSGDIKFFENTTSCRIAVGMKPEGSNNVQFFDGYMAEVVVIDGTVVAPTSFGEFDSDSPNIWKPIDVSGLTFGTNGFYLDFEDSSNLGNDANGGTDLTETNLAAADQASDTPTNNFCVLNGINPRHSDLTMSEGNCALASTNAQWLGVSSTMAVSRGKWYAEWKYISGHNMKFGIVGNGGADVAWLTANVSYGGYLPVGYEYQYNNSGTGYRVNNNVSPSWSNGSFSSADSIIMMAFDADAGKIWWGRDGTWFNNTGTANPATGTDASTSSISSDNAPYIISCALEGSGSTGFVNFGGCPAFAISSAVADGNGYGAFEYAPPSGFFSLCTKNLANYG